MGIPKLYQKYHLSKLQGLSQEKKLCLDAISSGKSVFLFGKTGTGKTNMGVGLMFEYLKTNKPTNSAGYPLFLSTSEFFLELKDTFGKKDSERDVLDRYSKAKLLLIDDIGTEKITDYSRPMLFSLIDRRYREEKQTIITSNLDLEMIAKLIDDRISSRIVGMGIVLNLTGEDYRLNQ